MTNAVLSEYERLNDPRQVAIHEAGHTVVARMLDFEVGQVTIVPDFELAEAGFAIVSDPYAIMWTWEQKGKFRELDTILRARAIIYMAGAEAEIEVFGNCLGGDGPDRDQVLDALERVGVAGPATAHLVDSQANYERFEPRLRCWTRTLVKRHRAKIVRLAAALLERKTLNAEEIEALIRVA